MNPSQRRPQPTSAVGVPGYLKPVYPPQASKMLGLVEADLERVDLCSAIVDAIDSIL